jgi:plastocyanin
MLAAMIGLALVAAGCGGDEEEPAATQEPAATEEPSGGGGETLNLSAPADGSLSFNTDTLSAAAGTLNIEFSNPSSVPHAVAVEGNGVEEESETVTGGRAPLTAELEAGEYTFYCPVGDHRQAGMEGTLTVE